MRILVNSGRIILFRGIKNHFQIPVRGINIAGKAGKEYVFRSKKQGPSAFAYALGVSFPLNFLLNFNS